MTYFLFFTLCFLSVFFLLLGMRTKDGIFQFPVIFSGAFAFSIVPQLVNHVFYPGRLPLKVYEDHGVEYGLLMCILCLVAGNLGYRSAPRNGAAGLRRFIPNVSAEKLFWAGAVLGLIGLYGATRVDALAGGFKARFTQGGHYALEWTGAPVFWTYVGKMLWIGLPLALLGALRRGSPVKWALTLTMMVYPLMSIILLGRRSGTFGLAVLIALSLWFHKRWAPPRLVGIAALAVGGLLIILLPYYRTEANLTGDVKGAMQQVDAEAALDAYLQGERGEGMDNLIIGIPARLESLSFGWGSGFWDGAVDYLVPAQIVGRAFKDGLMLQVGGRDDEVFSDYCGLQPDYGAFSTGPYSAFREFWFAGCLLFWGMAWFYRRLWFLASEQRLLGAQVLYISVGLLPAMATVNSLTSTFPMFLLVVGVLLPAMWVVRERHTGASVFRKGGVSVFRKGGVSVFRKGGVSVFRKDGVSVGRRRATRRAERGREQMLKC